MSTCTLCQSAGRKPTRQRHLSAPPAPRNRRQFTLPRPGRAPRAPQAPGNRGREARPGSALWAPRQPLGTEQAALAAVPTFGTPCTRCEGPHHTARPSMSTCTLSQSAGRKPARQRHLSAPQAPRSRQRDHPSGPSHFTFELPGIRGLKASLPLTTPPPPASAPAASFPWSPRRPARLATISRLSPPPSLFPPRRRTCRRGPAARGAR